MKGVLLYAAGVARLRVARRASGSMARISMSEAPLLSASTGDAASFERCSLFWATPPYVGKVMLRPFDRFECVVCRNTFPLYSRCAAARLRPHMCARVVSTIPQGVLCLLLPFR